jgi:antirestriction protein
MENDPQLPEDNDAETQSAAAGSERDPREGPRVYVASLSDFNSGLLHGAWLSAGVEEDELQKAIGSMLASSPSPGAEEFAIFDYEGFGPLRIDEYTPLSSLSAIACGIAEHGVAYAHWVASGGSSERTDLLGFEDAYLGHWESLTSYAENFLDDLGALQQIEKVAHGYLQPYVRLDIEGFARDLELAGDIWTSPGDGGVYVFDGRS